MTKKVRNILLKRILILNALSILIAGLAYFGLVFSISNLHVVWGVFRSKDLYRREDMIPPTAPFLKQLPNATQESVIDITGGTEEGVKVTLYVDDVKSDTTIADNDGQFTFANVRVYTQPQRFYVTAEDENGNVSSESQPYTIYRDNEPPEFEITSFTNGDTIKNTTSNYTVKGVVTEPESTVLVNGQIALIDLQGNFSARIQLSEGKNNVKVTVHDQANNTTEEEYEIDFEKIKNDK